ncbi:putative peptidase [Vibrio nigripulchritudo SFn27]|uniref:Putative peptidase n=1 Tax=Vibrio nigripulchritudo TaxID=28173 RepID=U4KDX8_9VIBR|nr:penicillin-insensitive murein endopeptidase [Vibrio nigripulchritudo]CCN81915.1 putative peptidase [Vibrio nigripulchritudo BLFn1]CCN90378.1 putative peptidase [Vibrio nigripulchritudo SFn27]CCN93848.1 putative peptidase [Vibrio nigripulchritudo ENn2]CCO42876.1 putative peptidase [Vibrio nigripulchritudo SFn135]CCO55664.1 putative peptidase [Vibrio nigripulchritudo Wn13]
MRPSTGLSKLFLSLSILSLPVIGAQKSVCFGTTSNGSLEGGVKLPLYGENFETYSYTASVAGRTYVHSEVKAIILSAYKNLELSHPDKVFKYAETGFEEGGKFSPHKTHRNGLSVDFMTPMINEDGESVHLPTHPFNKLGYDIELDKKGRYDELGIDYTALAAHLVELHKESKKRGHDLWRVIFDPKLQAGLFKTTYGTYIKDNIRLSKRRSWVRHDEHYHVDFIVPCKK